MCLRSQKQLDTQVSACYDSIALFLCIHIIHRYRVIMNKRSVAALDRYDSDVTAASPHSIITSVQRH